MRKLYTIIFLLGLIPLIGQNLEGVKIYINPGHGGFNSDDRNVVIYPFTSGDENGFWESQSNLDKGLFLKQMLEQANAQVWISRTQNRTEDDLPLSQIVEAANQVDADFMLSIHSNAGGANGANYILQLYAGKDVGDTFSYPSPTPYSDKGRDITTLMSKFLFNNNASVWSAAPSVRGDKTFGRTAMGWSDGYGVLRNLAIPGTISEGSMHDYIPETYRLMNMEYKWMEAWNFFKTFCVYFKTATIGKGNIAGTIHDSYNKKENIPYKCISKSKDEKIPLHQVKISLMPGNQIYQTDELYNGFFAFKNLTPGQYELSFEVDGYYTKKEQIEVKADETSYQLILLDKIRSTPPEVISFSPNVSITDSVECSALISFDFNWDIDEVSAQEAFSITPAISGKFSFINSNRTMVFKADQPFERQTVYHVKLNKSLKHRGGISMEKDFDLSFLTKNRNRLKMITSFPASDDVIHFERGQFMLIFDNKLDLKTATDSILVYNKDGESITKVPLSIIENTVNEPYGSVSFILAESLVPDEDYILKIHGGLTDKAGIPFVEPLEIKFKATNLLLLNKDVAESFDNTNILSFISDKSLGVSSAGTNRTLVKSKRLFGTAAWECKYSFNPSQNGQVYYSFNTPVSLTNIKCMGIHLNGDLSNNELFFVFNADNSEVEFKLCDLNYVGWQYKEFNLPETLISSNNAVLNGLRVKQPFGYLHNNGYLILDNLTSDTRFTGMSENTFPNNLYRYDAANKRLYITQKGGNVGVKLYNINGVLLHYERSAEVSFADYNSGVYMLHIITNETSFKTQFIIQ